MRQVKVTDLARPSEFLKHRLPMRLVVATPHYPPESGGPATYAKILADDLPGLGTSVAVVPFEEVRRYPKLVRPLLYLRLVLARARRADLILALDPVSTGVPAAMAGLLLGKPLVVKIVGDTAWERGRQLYRIDAPLDEFVRTKRIPAALSLYRYAQRWVATRAKRIIVPSEYLKTVIAAWGVSPDKIIVIYNSVERKRSGRLPDLVRETQEFTIATVARLVAWKHIDAIIAATRQIAGARLIIVGDGPERGRLEQLAGGDPRVLFTGALTNEDALAVIERADALVLNSSYEGLSHVLVEGLVAGVPIVASDAGGNPEVLADGSGLLVPVGDTQALTEALRRIKDEPGLADQLRRAAGERARAFSTEMMVERTMQLLESVAGRG